MVNARSRVVRRIGALIATGAIIGSGGVVAPVQASAGTHHAVLLRKGSLGKNIRWKVGVMRGPGKSGGRQPCIGSSIVNLKPEGYPEGMSSESDNQLCSALPATGPPIMLTSPGGNSGSRVTILGMAFAPAVHLVRMHFSSGRNRVVRPKRLSRSQARSAGVRELRYAAIPYRGDQCVEDLVLIDAHGNTLFKDERPAVECAS